MDPSAVDDDAMVAIAKKLEVARCPFICDVGSAAIAELLFTPGESRTRLLQWLLISYNSEFESLLQPTRTTAAAKLDPKLQCKELVHLSKLEPDIFSASILKVLATFGLCRYDDFDLIKGTAPSQKQVNFLNRLLDLVIHRMEENGIEISSLEHLDVSFPTMNLGELIDNIASSVDISAVLNAGVSFIPSDIKKDVQQKKTSKRQLSLEVLTTQLSDIDSRLGSLSSTLGKYVVHFEDKETARLNCINEELEILAPELDKTLLAFSSICDVDLRLWCSTPSLKLSQLGPTLRHIHDQLLRLINVIKTFWELGEVIDKLKLSSSELTKIESLYMDGISATLQWAEGGQAQKFLVLVQKLDAMIEETTLLENAVEVAAHPVQQSVAGSEISSLLDYSVFECKD